MLEILNKWYCRYFNYPEAKVLLGVMLAGFSILFFFGTALTPLFVAIVLAYPLDWPTALLEKIGCSRLWATSIVLSIFVGILILIFFILMPIAWQQSIYLIRDIPSMISKLSNFTATLPNRFPTLIDAGILDAMAGNLRSRIITISDSVVRYSFASLARLLTAAIYIVLVPLMIFFLIKDKEQMLNAVRRLVPCNYSLVRQIWKETTQNITNYIRGKVIEMIVIGVIDWFIFIIFGLNYPILLAILIGFSVIVPYIGVFIATIPLVGVALFQFGFSTKFWICMAIYMIIQILDGNLLVPIIFSEVVNLHPLTIILSVVIFGKMWDFWGIFFAIPLATMIKSIVYVWQKRITKIK